MWAIGNISESFVYYLSNVPVKNDIMELHKIIILGTAHILGEVA